MIENAASSGTDWVQRIADIATAVGVVFAAAQITMSKRQDQSAFEEGMNARYREIAKSLPLKALLGRGLSEDELNESLKQFYLYFDLSNEQAFLFRQKRINKKTWKNWHEGITQHLARQAFLQAWERLSPDLDGSFDELRTIMPRMPLPPTSHNTNPSGT